MNRFGEYIQNLVWKKPFTQGRFSQCEAQAAPLPRKCCGSASGSRSSHLSVLGKWAPQRSFYKNSESSALVISFAKLSIFDTCGILWCTSNGQKSSDPCLDHPSSHPWRAAFWCRNQQHTSRLRSSTDSLAAMQRNACVVSASHVCFLKS